MPLCHECGDGYQISTCIEIAHRSNGDNATRQSVGRVMNSTDACLLSSQGTNRDPITSTCVCNEVKNGTRNLQTQKVAHTTHDNPVATAATMAFYVTFPCFIILMCVLCHGLKNSRGASVVRPGPEEPDSNEARKQRERVLEILFPPGGEKVGTARGSVFFIPVVIPDNTPSHCM